ncbi:hypothetical protein LPB87_17440, partial [Flavobacterium sp. EDS]|uniref:hypothetical protein n=1 Tax=Flavobacterium sp. EDS TaxID=2897328 RepID=UPI001E5D798C
IADPCYYCPDEEEPTGGSGGYPIPLREIIITTPPKSTPPSFPPMTFIPRGPAYGAVDPPEYTNPPRGGGGGGSSSIGNTENPCDTAKSTTANAKSPAYISAKSNIIKASADGLEHSITLGKDANGNITQAPMSNGSSEKVKVNTTWAGAFGAMHNHPNQTPVSGGDIYAAVTLNTGNSNFTTSFILTKGETYAIVVTDLAAAQVFTASYPADISPIYPPEFPEFIFDQISFIRSKLGESNEVRTMAIASVLDKYNAGITLMRQDSDGQFNPIKVQETTQPDGTKTYTKIPCNK